MKDNTTMAISRKTHTRLKELAFIEETTIKVLLESMINDRIDKTGRDLSFAEKIVFREKTKQVLKKLKEMPMHMNATICPECKKSGKAFSEERNNYNYDFILFRDGRDLKESIRKCRTCDYAQNYFSEDEKVLIKTRFLKN